MGAPVGASVVGDRVVGDCERLGAFVGLEVGARVGLPVVGVAVGAAEVGLAVGCGWVGAEVVGESVAGTNCMLAMGTTSDDVTSPY